MNDDDVTLARLRDPDRGPFCAVSKNGTPQHDMPPTRRDPTIDRQKNPRGTRHIRKTFQDSQPKEDRARYQAWLMRIKKAQAQQTSAKGLLANDLC